MGDKTTMQILVHPEDTPLVLLAMAHGKLTYFTEPADLLPGTWTTLEDCDYGGTRDWETLANLGVRFLASHDSGYDYLGVMAASTGHALFTAVVNDLQAPSVALYQLDHETGRVEVRSQEEREREIQDAEDFASVWNSVSESIKDWKERFKSNVDNT